MGLLHQDGAVILVEKTVYRELQEELSARDSPYASIKGAFEESVQEFTPDKNVDLIMCLGGDGVILHASSLFQGPCPPVLGFNLGSMGFLAPHAFTVRPTRVRVRDRVRARVRVRKPKTP